MKPKYAVQSLFELARVKHAEDEDNPEKPVVSQAKARRGARTGRAARAAQAVAGEQDTLIQNQTYA